MGRRYRVLLAAAAALLLWADLHTDEIPFLLGLTLIAAAALGAAEPRRRVVTWMVTGEVMFAAQLAVWLGWFSAPWPERGFPGAALAVPLLPSALGAFGGACVRRRAR